jgi:hypothetical protein
VWLLDKDTVGFELQSNGINSLAAPTECKDGSCAGFTRGAYLQMPRHNFGQYAGLTFAFWFKVTDESGSGAAILDFSSGQGGQESIRIARSGATQDVQFAVAITASAEASSCIGPGLWQTNTWKHVVWTLAPTTGTAADWQVKAKRLHAHTAIKKSSVNADSSAP